MTFTVLVRSKTHENTQTDILTMERVGPFVYFQMPSPPLLPLLPPAKDSLFFFFSVLFFEIL